MLGKQKLKAAATFWKDKYTYTNKASDASTSLKSKTSFSSKTINVVYYISFIKLYISVRLNFKSL